MLIYRQFLILDSCTSFQGLGKQFLFSHHGDAYKDNRVTWYDQQFNKREVTEGDFKPLRTWERQRLVWAPEKSDYPIQGEQKFSTY